MVHHQLYRGELLKTKLGVIKKRFVSFLDKLLDRDINFGE